MLYNHVERGLIKAGIDPYVGIMHRNEYNRPVLVYDMIEQYRVWADFVVINLCMQKVMFPDFFDVENNVWLLNENGKRILIQSINDYMNEIVERNGKQRSRITHIELDAQNFASKLKKWKEDKKSPF
jgi:CRISPR-associated protein Cas1